MFLLSRDECIYIWITEDKEKCMNPVLLIVITAISTFVALVIINRLLIIRKKKVSDIIGRLKILKNVDFLNNKWIEVLNDHLEIILWMRLKFIFNYEKANTTRVLANGGLDISFLGYLMGQSFISRQNLIDSLSELISYVNVTTSDTLKLEFSKYFSVDYFDEYVNTFVMMRLDNYSKLFKLSMSSNVPLEGLSHEDLCLIRFEEIGEKLLAMKKLQTSE